MAIDIDRSEGVRDSARGLHVLTLCARDASGTMRTFPG